MKITLKVRTKNETFSVYVRTVYILYMMNSIHILVSTVRDALQTLIRHGVPTQKYPL